MRDLIIDLDAIAANFHTMKNRAGGAKVMSVVKANAYGHGMIEVALKLEQEKADFFGVADVDEALELREYGIETPILAWLHDPEDRFVEALDNQIDLGVANLEQLERIADAARLTNLKARVHLKVDTGLSRNGSTLADWPALLEATKDLIGQGLVEVVGVFSHLSSTGEAEDRAQIEKFEQAVQQVRDAGIDFELRHLTASDGSLSYPEAHYDMVRIGVALYGLSPFADHHSAEYQLRPAMTATAHVTQVKRVEAGTGISYGYLARADKETTLALVPVGYYEGLPRNATGKYEVSINGKRYKIEARIAMDQFVVDVGDDEVAPGDEVIIFGDPASGVPSVDDLASACETINYEIVTRMGGRFKRHYLGSVE
ncbi:MAG: alanine racemase [Micrococcales bacterium]